MGRTTHDRVHHTRRVLAAASTKRASMRILACHLPACRLRCALALATGTAAAPHSAGSGVGPVSLR